MYVPFLFLDKNVPKQWLIRRTTDCAAHYKSWQKEFSQAADRFVPGGFGENLVLGFMNERNVCIGDIFEISDSTAVLQISLPRQPW